MFLRCADCGDEKPIDAFPQWLNPERSRAPRCKECHYARRKAGIEKRWGNTRHYHLQRKYGISAADVEILKSSQGGTCPVCRERPAVHVDHDHQTRRVRGILCELCNGFLGAFSDDPDIIRSAIEYLERHQ